MAESVMVMALLSILFAAILQFCIIIHVRNTLIDAASAGARYGALGDQVPDDGAARTRDLLAGSIPGGEEAEVSAQLVGGDGTTLVRVTVHTQMPMIGFLGGPVGLEADGHAYRY
ncbi:TadE family protein [Citricoccus sp. GCM10030269]|uniref:TadE family protein n=1 Tax=Citricoccus sp. GCM10030269 TaxID=3273388 RepID=UPI00360B8E0D